MLLAATRAKVHLFLVIACLATKWSSSLAQKKEPSFVKTITLKVEGEEECIRTSDYIKPASGPCKDLGQCYQYRCGAIARHCSQCGEYKSPCLDYEQDADEGGVNSRRRRSAEPEEEEEEEEEERVRVPEVNFMQSITSRMRRLVEKVRAVVQTVPSPQTVPIESMGNSIVHLRAGLQNCTGFVTSVEGPEGRHFLILTAAKCLVNFRTECFGSSPTFGEKFEANVSAQQDIDGYTMYPYKHAWPCFGDYDADVTRIKKGFRSYTVKITSYMGHSYTIPLDSRHVIVPRDYMECQDCRHDIAAIKLKRDTVRRILRHIEPFILAPDKDPMEWTGAEVPQLVSVKSDIAPTLLRKAADTRFCTISYATKEKMCFHLPLGPSNENLVILPGSPLFVPVTNKRGETKYHCIGVFTGTYSTANAVMSTQQLIEDGLSATPEGNHISLNMKYTRNGAVRITPDFVSLLEKLGGNPKMNSTTTTGNETGLVPQVFPPRRECYPNGAQPYNGTEHLFLCSLGWKDEKDGCVHPDIQISEGCSWNGQSFKCGPRIRRNQLSTGDPLESIFQFITLPGTTKQLSLRGQRISDVIELSAALSRLPQLQDLILDYNDIAVLTTELVSGNRELRTISLKHNKLSKLTHDAFRHNKKLRQLNLAYNQIKVIPSDLLAKAAILQFIDLEKNSIGFVSQKLFARARRLEHIHLGFNNISQFSPKLLLNLNALTEFRINNNNLKRLSSFSFTSNPRLSLVDLSHNCLNAVPKNTFDHNAKLRYVNLNYNNITILPRRLFLHQRDLVVVDASHNPLLHPNRTRLYFESSGIPYS